MWRISVLGVVAGCYSPHAVVGAPCSPAHPSCPDHQFCAPVGGGFECVDSLPDDAGVDPPGEGSDAPDGAVPHWTMIQSHESTGQRTSIAPPVTGNLLVVAFENVSVFGGGNVTDDAGNTYTLVPGSQARDLVDGTAVEIWYATVTRPGATTVTVSAGSVHATVVWEVAGIRAQDPVDTASKLDDQPPSATPSGAPITTATAGELVISIAGVSNNVSGIHAGNEFTNDFKTKGNGWAHLADPAAPAGVHLAMWDQPNGGRYCAASAAFLLAP